MAVIESAAFVGTKKWSEGAAWVGGVSPGIKDDAVLTAGAGTIEVTTAVKVKSIDGTAHKASLKLAEKSIALAAELEGAGMAFKWGTEQKIETIGNGAIELVGAKSSTPELTTNGSGAGRTYKLVFKGSGIKVKLLDALITEAQLFEILRCADFLTENNTIEALNIIAPGELSTTIHFGKSTVRVGSNGIQLGEGVTITASEATFEGQGTGGWALTAAKNHTFGTVKCKGSLAVEPTGAAPRSTNITDLKLEHGERALESERELRINAEGTLVVGTISTNASSTAKRTVILSAAPGVAAKLKKAAGKVELDYIEVKDNTAEGEIPFKALSNSVLGTGNTNWELVETGTTKVAGTTKIKLQAVNQTAVVYSAAGTTKVTFKTASAPVATLSAAGTTKVRFAATDAVSSKAGVAASTQVTFDSHLKVTVETEGRTGTRLVFLFEE